MRQGAVVRAESRVDGQPKLDSSESDFSSTLYLIPPPIFSLIFIQYLTKLFGVFLPALRADIGRHVLKSL